MEIIQNIAAILGLLLTAASVITLLSKTVRGAIKRLFAQHDKCAEDTELKENLSNSITELKQLLEKHIADDKEHNEQLAAHREVYVEFMRVLCRNIIKNIFYKYLDTKVLPLYEKKTLMSLEKLYIEELHCNSFATLLLKEMSSWDVDYAAAYPEENE